MQSFRKSVASSFLCSKGAGYSSSLGTIGLMKAVDTGMSDRIHQIVMVMAAREWYSVARHRSSGIGVSP